MASPYDGKTVLDGEIVCLDNFGRPQFNNLLFHKAEPCFFAFDLLMSDGKDLRTERLSDLKQQLRRLLSRIVAKHSLGNYVTDRWLGHRSNSLHSASYLMIPSPNEVEPCASVLAISVNAADELSC
jgi:hypothetical protein